MKLTIQFTNDNTDELSEDLDLEIDDAVYAQIEKKAKEKNVSVDDMILHILESAVAEAKLQND